MDGSQKGWHRVCEVDQRHRRHSPAAIPRIEELACLPDHVRDTTLDSITGTGPGKSVGNKYGQVGDAPNVVLVGASQFRGTRG